MKVLAGVLLLAALLGVSLVQATHFRFGTLRWVQEAGGNGRQFLFTIDTAWRRTFFNQGNFGVGSTLGEEAVFVPDARRADQATRFAMVVNVINVQADWFIAQQQVRYSFNDPGFTTASYQRCCRISTLVNNKDRDFRIQARVFIPSQGGNLVRSIVTTAIPIVTVIERELATFAIPATAPNPSDALRYRLSLGNEALSQAQANDFRPVPLLTVDYESGLIRWVPQERGLYTTQVTIEQHSVAPQNPGDNRNLQTSTAVDFIINVIGKTDKRCKRFCDNKGDPCGGDGECFNCRDDTPRSGFFTNPMCDPNTPPRFTKVTTRSGTGNAVDTVLRNNPEVVTGTLGLPFTLTMEAIDDDPEDRITITSTTLPNGASAPSIITRNPGTHSLTWVLNEQVVICYSAIDDLLNPSLGQQCVRVAATLPVMTASGSCLTSAIAGESCTFQINNVANRNHAVEIRGEAGVFQTTSITARNGGTSNNVTYDAVYSNVPTNAASYITRAGFYTLRVTDTIAVNPPIPIFTNLQVRPAATHPPSAFSADVGSTGLIGGRANQNLFFYLLSRDRFRNEILERRTDSYYCEVLLIDPVTTPAAEPRTFPIGEFQQGGDPAIANRFRLTYTVPNSNVDGRYRLRIFYRNTALPASQTPQLADERILTVQSNTFQAEIRAQGTYIAGNPIDFRVEVFDTNIKTLQVEVNGVPIPFRSTPVTNPNGRSVFYPYSAPPMNKSTTVEAPVRIRLRGAGISNVNTDGFVEATFGILPGPPSAPDLPIDGPGVTEMKAGVEGKISLQLVDKFLNDIIVPFQEVLVARVARGIDRDGKPFTRSSSLALTHVRNGRYEGGYVETVAGESEVTITWKDGTILGESPYKVLVEAAEFGIATSSFSFLPSQIAGRKGFGVVSAADRYGNIRNGGDDRFRVRFILKENDNAVLEADSNWRPISGSRYSFEYNSTKAGLYDLLIEANIPNQGGFVSFRDVKVRVLPDEVVPENVGLTGAGTSGGTIGKEAQLLMQARDQYLNPVLKAGSDWFAVEVVTQAGTKTYYKAEHVPGNIAKTDSTVSSFGSLQNNPGAPAENLSPDELLLVEQGYWKLNYVVPNASGRSKEFTINTYYANASQITGDINDPEQVITSGQAMLVKESTATATSGATLRSPSDNWPIIAGSVFGAALVLSLGGYTYWRLQRYRPKYLLEKERAEEAERQLREMAEEIDIIPGGRDFEAMGAATVSANPLHEAYQLKHKPKEELEMVDDPKDIKMEVSRPAIRKEFQPQRTGATAKFNP